MREQIEFDGNIDVNNKKQQAIAPKIDEPFFYTCIQCLYEFKETDGTKIDIWCKLLVVKVKNETTVHV